MKEKKISEKIKKMVETFTYDNYFTTPIWYHIMVNKHKAKALYPNMMSLSELSYHLKRQRLSLDSQWWNCFIHAQEQKCHQVHSIFQCKSACVETHLLMMPLRKLWKWQWKSNQKTQNFSLKKINQRVNAVIQPYTWFEFLYFVLQRL